MNIIYHKLPYPPSVNHMYGRGKNGNIFKTKKANDFLNLGKNMLLQHPRFGKAKVSVKMMVYPPDKRRRDIDNILKLSFDLLMHAQIIDDDSQIVNLSLEKYGAVKNGVILIHISEIN